MDKDSLLLKKRFIELANRSYMENRFTFTEFLSEADLSCFYEALPEIGSVPYTLSDDTDQERIMVRFGSAEELGYTEEFPIAILLIKPNAEKFADKLTHRDFLGALMNLGIERDVLGDIKVFDKRAYVFCHEKIASYIIDNLSFVKHTAVKVSIVTEIPEIAEKPEILKLVQVPSLRIDAVVSRAYNLSRKDSIECFLQKKIFLNGRLMENSSKLIKEGDRITLRGKGRFKISEVLGTTKSGKINIKLSF
jgi:RNA-binding protein YlmH